MRQYEKIWVPIVAAGFNTLLEENGPIIVMTPKEALEMWNAGRTVAQQEITRENLSKVDAPHFMEYLHSKGIYYE